MKRLIPHNITKTTINELKCLAVQRGKESIIEREIVNENLRTFHYLGEFKGRGRRLSLIWYDTTLDDIIGIVVFSNPQALWLPDRDKWIGWTDEVRLKNLNKKVADEVRFLILPHIQVPNLASQILATSCKIARREWKSRYGDNLVLITCFTDPKLYEGHSYYGAGFKLIGHTRDGKRILAKSLKPYWKQELNR